jgi:hypothetical protein|tara:strand:- start:997 stop:1140 length:144 start_codon:yes stop_codon:yes gene_type:complete
MAQQKSHAYQTKTRVRRRNRPRPLNIRKTLGPRSAFAGSRKKRRGQG